MSNSECRWPGYIGLGSKFRLNRTNCQRQINEQLGRLIMKSSRVFMVSASVLLLAHGVVNAAGPAVALPGDTQVAAPAPGSPIPPGSQLTLKDAIAIALKYHPRLQEAADNTSAAQQQIGQARSYLGPQLFGAAQYLRSTDNGIGNASYYNPDGAFPRLTGTNHNLPSNDFSQSWDTSNNYMGGVMLSQFLVDFGRRHGFVSERQFEAAAAAADQTAHRARSDF